MNQTRFIAGSGRSGTTWLLDTLAAANKLRPVFEPLNPFASPVGRVYAHRVLSADDDHPELQKFLADVFAGRAIRLWSQYRRHTHWLKPSSAVLRSTADLGKFARRWGRFLREAPGLAACAANRDPLVKCIWSNLMMEWLAKRCDCRILFVVRHPGAVIESELRSGWSADDALARFKADPNVRRLAGGRYAPLLERRLEPVESLTLRWLIENQPILGSEVTGAAAVVHYEDLAAGSKGAWDQVKESLVLERIPDAHMLARPSQQSWPTGTESLHRRSPATGWMSGLASGQSGRIQKVLDDCGFSAYSMHDPQPCMAGAGAVDRIAGNRS